MNRPPARGPASPADRPLSLRCPTEAWRHYQRRQPYSGTRTTCVPQSLSTGRAICASSSRAAITTYVHCSSTFHTNIPRSFSFMSIVTSSCGAVGAGCAWRLSSTSGLYVVKTTRKSHPARGGSKKVETCATLSGSSVDRLGVRSLVGQLRRLPLQGWPPSRCTGQGTARITRRRRFVAQRRWGSRAMCQGYGSNRYVDFGVPTCTFAFRWSLLGHVKEVSEVRDEHDARYRRMPARPGSTLSDRPSLRHRPPAPSRSVSCRSRRTSSSSSSSDTERPVQ